jgi:hypothetical protein
MHWVYYWRNVVRRYQVSIEGWPEKHAFKNLSTISISITDLEDILRHLRVGRIYWHKLTDEEFKELDGQREADILAGNIKEPAHRRRSDYGKKRSRGRNDGNQGPAKKHRSRSVIDTNDETDGGAESLAEGEGSGSHGTVENN